MGVTIAQNDDGSLGLRSPDGPNHGGFIAISTEYTASSVDKSFFVADRPYKVKEVTGRVETAGTDVSAVTAQIVKVASGTAISSGTRILGGSAAEDTDFDFTSHTIVAGDTFTLNSPGTAYYVWYTVDGAGTDPTQADRGIQVDILSTDTDAQVATKTKNAIDRVGELTATVATNVVTVINDVPGAVTDAADVNTGVSVTVQTQGVDEAFDLKGTAATNQELTLTEIDANLEIAAGDCLAIDFTGTLTSAAGVVTVTLALL